MSNILPFSQDSFIYESGQYWLSAHTIAEALGYEDTSSIFKLYERNLDELEEYSTTVKLTVEGGVTRQHRVFNEEGIYIISMLARTERAKIFRRVVAQILKDMRTRREKQAFAEGIQIYRELEQRLHRSGKNRQWLDKLLYYHQLGLTKKDIATLMDTSKDTVIRYIKLAEPMQGVQS